MQNNNVTNVFFIHNDIEMENYKKAISLLNDDCLDKAWKYIEKINLANLMKKIGVNKLENEIYFAKYRSYVDWKGDIITVEESEGNPPPDPGCCDNWYSACFTVCCIGACCGVPIYDGFHGTNITFTACKQILKWSYSCNYSCPCCFEPC